MRAKAQRTLHTVQDPCREASMVMVVQEASTVEAIFIQEWREDQHKKMLGHGAAKHSSKISIHTIAYELLIALSIEIFDRAPVDVVRSTQRMPSVFYHGA